MRTSVVVLCVILLSGTTFGDDKKPVPGEKEMPVESDKAGIQYLRNRNGSVMIALSPWTKMDVDVQVKNGEVTVVGETRVRTKRDESARFVITLGCPKTLAITGVQMVATDAKRYFFTDSFGYRYLLVSGPPLGESAAMPLVGTLVWGDKNRSMVAFMETTVGQLQVTRLWMRYPRKVSADPQKK